ncbi:restriction endonuclease subunit S [Mycoplasmopsis bovis]|uniref:Putative type I restriction-modification system, S subunit n=1 Tax=Mycoplasmopsis bovis (strain ATCC 25523 / DSM 22781 / NCTC 10131 / PG45) TaxID=289397 RepID=A0A454AQC7_MYCBG|nr:restriction endonuclease subunit S [Mycoplasmopsis bovis]ADR25257.1 putative type I restriction-modification system, S subunit [Mycoplasmopsis bovis PG45]MBT1323149.1 restriction endonuclease subunit S [Mycoplasmopsis bovis]
MTADQLRKSILQWAIRGKLTKQNSDESAADLLNEIRSEKQKLIEENKVKKMDLINSFIYKNPGDNCYYEKFEDGREEKIEVPFEIPDNWRWVRINCAYQYIPTGVKKYSGSKKYFSTGSINYDNITPEQECLFNGRPTRANRIVYYNQIIEARMINTNKATIIDERLDGQLVSTGFFCYQVVLGEIEYLKIIFDSHYFKKTKNSLCTGTTQKSINDENLSKILVPLAPLEEQRRIVELIHKLDSLIGKYSKFEIELSELEEELPTKLEKSIINYAMKGKLVKQDQNNDSVDNLINEIYKEKQKLVEQGKLKKADLNNLIIYKNDNDNSYYENQSTKPYIKLGNIAELYTGDSINKTFKKKFLSAFSELSYISTKDVGFDKEISYDNGVWIPENFKNEYKIAPKNSILLCIEGGSAGRKMAITKRDVAFGNKLCCINSNNLSNKFLSYFFQCDTFKNMFNSKTKGIISGISLSNLKSIEIPIFSGTYQEKLINKLNLIGTIIKKLC